MTQPGAPPRDLRRLDQRLKKALGQLDPMQCRDSYN
jgi:hypothetical protein